MNTKIYVGTFAKYNNGDLSGEWLDVSDYSSAEQIMEAMKAIHEDEQDAEFMLQDIEGDAQKLGVDESMSLEDWEQVYEALEAVECSHLVFEAIKAYADNIGEKITPELVENAEEAYQGEYDSDEDFAENLAEELGYIDGNASWPHTCIDWQWAARELMYDYFESNGYYFRNL